MLTFNVVLGYQGLLFRDFLWFFFKVFFFSIRPTTQYQETHSTVNEEKKGMALEQLCRQHQSSRYVRPCALEKELSNFLFSLSPPRVYHHSFANRRGCIPCMERSWKTNTRPSTGLPEAGTQCPLRLAHGVVDSLVYNRQIEINLLTVFFSCC